NRCTLPRFPTKILGRWRKRVVRCWDFPHAIIVASMPGPSGRPSERTRRPVVAGMFYPADPGQCAAAASQLVAGADVRRAAAPSGRVWRGGIAPHAGWICSGAIAGETLAAIQASRLAAASTPRDPGTARDARETRDPE